MPAINGKNMDVGYRFNQTGLKEVYNKVFGDCSPLPWPMVTDTFHLAWMLTIKGAIMD